MLLYVVYDSDKKTLSTPLLAPTLEIANSSLKELNPENLNSLILHPLLTLSSPLDLFLLNLDQNKPLPNFILGRDNSLELSDPTSETRESL